MVLRESRESAKVSERVLARWGCRGSTCARAGQRALETKLVGAEEGGLLTPKFGELKTWTHSVMLGVD